ncbi:MAG: hypothetical protein GY940_27725, partial [bacterium]|nr:hypothetical protein [bacterium]
SLLKRLYLDYNRLTGNIPSQLGNLSLLKRLDLENNRLTGNIPSALGNLSLLEQLQVYNNGLTGSIPTTLTNLTNLSYLDIDYNGLYTSNTTLRTFLESKDRYWEETQTIPPINVSAVGLTSTVIRVRWTNNGYTGGGGGFKVYYSTTSGGPWTYSGMTSDKYTNYYDVTGLSLGITYYFTVKSHTEKPYKNLTITSQYSKQGSGTTTTTSPQIGLDRAQLNFAYIIDSYNRPDQFFNVSPTVGSIIWTATGNVSWIYLTPSSGMDSGRVEVSIYPYYLSAGTYSGTITIKDAYASNSPTVVTVNLEVYEEGKTSEPFGQFSTPVNGSTVISSIAVTGWALDDIGIDDVKIYRKEGGSRVYIGEALLVEGARPDVKQAYPSYPYNYKAGWGYMLLTNFLPNGGNGTYTLQAIATDKEGNEVTLGTKTITCDNANALKPFGAIDTPDQGGTASGDSFVNWGWALTPQPNSISTNGSTIDVFVNGVNLGHPTYNIYLNYIV